MIIDCVVNCCADTTTHSVTIKYPQTIVMLRYICITILVSLATYNIYHLPAVNGSRPKLSRFALVMASSKLPHVTPTFNCDHFSRVTLKHSLSCIGLADAARSSTDDFSPSRTPISLQCLQ